MAHIEMQEDKTKNMMEEITEEQFLKNIYLFMKKRDTPIDRIPNLGFKQIDLFLMFKTVNDLGGYHQVTSHQLWKQVYNTLGGNPRSTSAATCTRRHYEKLLLPYECHLRGILISSVPQPHKPKPYPDSRDDDVGQRPSKRRLSYVQLQQGSHNFHADQDDLYPLHPHYLNYYHPNNPVLPPYVPMPPSVLPPHGSTFSKPQFPFQPSRPDSRDTIREPLQQLRDLAEQYKSLSGLAEPLNLSVKASSRDSNGSPVSSFSPPSSSKTPKFLNKPSTLYAPQHSGVLRNEECEAQDGESCREGTSFSYAAYTKPLTTLESPVCGPALTLEVDKDAPEMMQKPSSPKMDFEVRPAGDRETIPEKIGFSLSHMLQSLPQPKDGKMEIEVPLSVFCNWLKLHQSPAMMHKVKEPVDHEEPLVQKSWSDLDIPPSDLTCQLNHQRKSLAEDLRQRNEPSPTSNTQTTSPLLSYRKSPPSGGNLKNASSQNVWSFDQQNTDKSYNFKSTDLWDASKKESLASPTLGNCESGPLRAQQDFASNFSGAGSVGGSAWTAGAVPSSLLKLNSNSANVLHLTPEELMKLKKIISNS